MPEGSCWVLGNKHRESLEHTAQSGEHSLLGCAREDAGSGWGTRNLRLVKLGGSKEGALCSMPPQPSLLRPAGRRHLGKQSWCRKPPRLSSHVRALCRGERFGV